jgi:hypothetical protein
MPCFTSEKTRVFIVSEPRRRKYNLQNPIGKGLTWELSWITVQHVDQFANPRTSGYFAIDRDAVPANPWQNLALRYSINPRKLLLLTAITYQTGDLVLIAFHTRVTALVSSNPPPSEN